VGGLKSLRSWRTRQPLKIIRMVWVVDRRARESEAEALLRDGGRGQGGKYWIQLIICEWFSRRKWAGASFIISFKLKKLEVRMHRERESAEERQNH
jgi:hypothetical protein